MAAVSISLSRGVEGMAPVDFTVGTSAPGAGDFEIRVSTNITTKIEVIKALKAFERAFEDGEVPLTTTPIL